MGNIAAKSSGQWTPAAADSAAPQSTSLFEMYKRWFDVVPATTAELRKESYRLRYQVYCVENEFEKRSDYPDGLETDAHDEHSAHTLLVHRPTGTIVGTVRLILPVPGKGIESLPISKVCTHPALRDPALFPPGRTAEISRFAVSKSFRRRAGDARGVDLSCVEQNVDTRLEERRALAPNITIGLMQAVARMSLDNGITHLCAVMEPALLRLTSRLGIQFKLLGPLVEYHGTRQPCSSDIVSLANVLLNRRPDALEVISNGGLYRPEQFVRQ